eukprot:m51a1_g6761 putative endoribonuclease l-psp (129) ;mRNA; r:94892-95358
MAARSVIATTKAPGAIGPYSQAIVSRGTCYTSGQIPIVPATGALCTGTVTEQTHQVMLNLGAILEAAGTGFASVIKTTCFLRDMNDFAEFNKEYATFFPQNAPARSCVQVARLPKDVAVEVEAIAIIP